MKKTLVRFPNTSEFIEVENFKWDEFKPEQEFETETFGWYLGTYISILKKK
jgi:hypothetical protein